MNQSFLQPRDTILFQGDSITNAFRRPAEINNAYQLGAGYSLLIASQLLLQCPTDQLHFLNRGDAGIAWRHWRRAGSRTASI